MENSKTNFTFLKRAATFCSLDSTILSGIGSERTVNDLTYKIYGLHSAKSFTINEVYDETKGFTMWKLNQQYTGVRINADSIVEVFRVLDDGSVSDRIIYCVIPHFSILPIRVMEINIGIFKPRSRSYIWVYEDSKNEAREVNNNSICRVT